MSDKYRLMSELANIKLEEAKELRLPYNTSIFRQVKSNKSETFWLISFNYYTFEYEKNNIKKIKLQGLGIDTNTLPNWAEFKVWHKLTKEYIYEKTNYFVEVSSEYARNIIQEKVDAAYLFRRNIYDEYMCSQEWYEKRKECFSTHGLNCLDCGSVATDIHHLHYETLGDEDPQNDLHPLCNSCHHHRHTTGNLYGVVK